MKTPLVLALLASSLACAATSSSYEGGGSSPASSSSSGDDGSFVAYEKYQLANGMTVILHEDHSTPQAAVNVWYRVGAKDEPAGRSGFAHLFEHLMFMGTARVPGLDFDNIMEAGGGSNNATTSSDRTNYFESGPAELLPTLLWLEADRMEAIGANMTQEKLDKQREVVRNERRQSYENQPYGMSYLDGIGLLWPEGHPYHIPVIGTHADLEAATVEDVKRFFATYYVPNNASLVVAGAFDSEVVKPMIENLFGSLPRGAEVQHKDARPIRLESEIRFDTTDQIQFPRVELAWHSPALYAPGDAELDILASILAGGISSRLYQSLIVEHGVAVDVEAYQASSLLGSTFHVACLANPEADLDRVEALMDEVLAELAASGPNAAELERQKAQVEYQTLSQLQNLRTKADRLNAYEFHFGEPDSFERDLDRYRHASVESTRKIARKVFGHPGRLVTRVLPNPRDERPEGGDPNPFSPAEPESFTLSNGLSVHLWQREELPLVALRTLFKTGADRDGDAYGLTSMVVDMLDEGTEAMSARDFSDALQQLGASFSSATSYESVQVDLDVLRRNFEPALALYADAILRPGFDEAEWERVHELRLSQLARAKDEPTQVAREVAMREFFGASHPYGNPIDGTEASVGKLRRAQVVAQHEALMRPSNAVLLVAGDLGAAEAREALEEAFGGWRGSSRPLPAKPDYPAPPARERRVVYVDRPGAVQTVVRWMMPAPTYADPQRPERELLGLILGGTFTSRLNKNLREDKGYTYGARSAFSMNPSAGYLTALSSVRANVTGPSVGEFWKEFELLREGGVAAVEAGKARATRRQRMIEASAGLSGILNGATPLVLAGRPFAEAARELERVGRVEADTLSSLAAQAVPTDEALLVLVGDGALIRAQLAELDFPEPVEVEVSPSN